MYCPGCGNLVPDGSKFCGVCGQKIRYADAHDAPPVAAQPRGPQNDTAGRAQNAPQNNAPGRAQNAPRNNAPGGAQNRQYGRQDNGSGRAQNTQSDTSRGQKKPPVVIVLAVIAAILVIAAVIVVVLFAVPSNTDAYQEQVDLGEQYLNKGNYEQAIVELTAAIAIDESQTDAYMARAEAYTALAEESAEAAESAEAEESAPAAESAEAGESAEAAESAEAGESAETAESEEGEESEEGSRDTYLDAALADYSTVISIDSTKTQAYIRSADIYAVHMSDYESAEEILEEGLAANPEDEDLTAALEQVEEQAEESGQDAAGPDQIADDSQTLTELLSLTYIGNTLYYAESADEAPIGCLDAFVYDLDGDGTNEIVTLENADSTYFFLPELCVYEYSEETGEWAKTASIKEGPESVDETGMINTLYCKYYFYEESVLVTDTAGLVTFAFLYDGSTLSETQDAELLALTRADLYGEAAEMTIINRTYGNSQELEEILEAYISSGIYADYDADGWIAGYLEGYGIALTDLRQLETYEEEDYSFSVPTYFSAYIVYENDAEDDEEGITAVYTKMESPYSTWDTVNIFGIYKDSCDWFDYSAEYADVSETTGLIGSDGGTEFLWQDGESCMYYACGGDKYAVLQEVAAYNQSLEDFVISIMILEDSMEACYHFETSLDGTVYP